MNFNLLSGHDKRRRWKEFREEINLQPNTIETLLSVQQFWEKVPLVHWCTDVDNPNTWLTPWEIIEEDTYSKSTLALMMYWTLVLSNDKKWNDSNLQLKLVQTLTEQEIFMVLIVDGKWLMNYSRNEIFDLSVDAEDTLYIVKDIFVKNKKGFKIK
jgi:hypothetical protein